MNRQFVHLSVDEAAARVVGQRHDRFPVVLRIRAREAAGAGIKFYPGNEQVWMVEGIPPAFIG
jgi:putative RNA 2'-phosphotransferase